ncbi:MAG: energy-coupling factor transporter ATPase [Clostridiales bacterium]|nr:energy-coupling factor transporter ATPase [Clostridiales bacterium]
MPFCRILQRKRKKMTAIKFEKVHFSYADDEQTEEFFAEEKAFSLDGVDFSVEEGEFVAVLGHNGSGKSTLARLTNGLLSPTDGEITVFGLDAKNPKNLFEIRKQVGIVFQNPDNQTVASIVEDDVAFGPENIGVNREEIGQRISFALDSVGMSDFRHATPTRLSGGQKQRIALAGVLALKPRVMILDEATAMLDPRGRKEVMDVVLRLNREEKITVILITHFPEEAMLADRAIVMSAGRIVMEGKPADVFARETELEKYALTLPRQIRACRGLRQGGIAVEDTMDENAIADAVLAVAHGGNSVVKKVTQQDEETKTAGDGTQSTAQNPEIAEEGAVRCDHLSFVYNPKSPFETHALDNVRLEIKPGDFFGIIGHTGSGKSTFVQHLNALLKVPSAQKKYKAKKPKKGQPIPPKTVLTVNGFDLTDKKTDFKALRSKVGMVFQYPEYQLFAETVFEDVAFGLKNFNKDVKETDVETAVREALETVGLNYEQIKGRSPFELSGGQKRRVAIAGVIVTKPQILVLDEPAAGLDPLGKEEIMALLHKIHGDWCKTVIIVSHDMDEIAENCNRAAVFSEGKIVVTDTPKGLFDDVEKILSLGLDVPFTAKIAQKCREHGIEIGCDYTVSDFVQKTLEYIKTQGDVTRLTQPEGGQIDA